MTSVSGTHARRDEIRFGLRSSLAAGLGLFPLGVALGLMVMDAGLPWWLAPALSVSVFAGSVELLMVGLIAAGTSLATIALTVLLVNFRHVFYAFTFPLHVVRGRGTRTYSVYALIDEAYAITAAAPGRWTHTSLLTLQLALQAYWVAGGLAGTLLAALLPGTIEGIEFALCALFVTLALDAARSRESLPSVVLGGLAFVIGQVVAPDSALFVSLLTFLALLAARHLLSRREAPDA